MSTVLDDERLRRLQELGLIPGAKAPNDAQPAPPGDPNQQYYLRANDMETQANAPAPRPIGAKQNIIAGLGAGLEAFANPHGYQQVNLARQQQDMEKRQQMLAQAKELRGQGQFEEQQQRLATQGQAENDYRTKNLASEDALRQAQIEQIKTKEVKPPIKLGKDEILVDSTDYKTKATGPAGTLPVDQQEMNDWLGKNKGKGPADWAREKANMSYHAPEPHQVLWGDDPSNPGKQAPFEYKNGKLTQIPLERTPTAITTAETKKGEAAKGVTQSVTALESLAKQNTYIADVAMADQFFNVVKPDSGARMNQSYIDRLMRPGPLANRMSVWAKQLDQGQMLTAQDRQYMIDAAHAIAESKTGDSAPSSGKKTVKFGELPK